MAKKQKSYFRMVEDIKPALERVREQQFIQAARFLAYYAACEKLARVIIGMHEHPTRVRRLGDKGLERLTSAIRTLSLPGSDLEALSDLFAGRKDKQTFQTPSSRGLTSARCLRDRLVHEFGPSNINKTVENAGALIPKMTAFLDQYTPRVLNHPNAQLPLPF